MSEHDHFTSDPSGSCGACQGIQDATPLEVRNRPGLSAIRYRVGDHARFKQSLLAGLSRASRPALRTLTTRDNDDFSIALLDAFATMADVVTFYQERIANEFYLRTATERLSVEQIARMIGYELRPGVAARTFLAFTLQEGPGSVEKLKLAVGTKVQSTPGQDETPQMFETVEEIEARTAWNRIKAKATQSQKLSSATLSVRLKGAALNLRAGDGILLVFKTPGGTDFTAVYGLITGVQTDPQGQWTSVTLTTVKEVTGKFNGLTDEEMGVYAFRARASLFGYNAPATKVDLKTGKKSGWSFNGKLNTEDLITLDTVYREIVPGSWVVWKKPEPTSQGTILKVTSAIETGLAVYGLSGKATELRVQPQKTHPVPKTLNELRTISIEVRSEKLELAEVPVDKPVTGTTIEFELRAEGLQPGQRVAVTGKSVELLREVSEIGVIASVAGDHKSITLKSPLAYSYDPATVTVNANVAEATHGETVQEVLGSGDATQAFQPFTLRQPPLTHVAALTPSGTRSTLRVWVDDVEWREVPTLYGRGPKDRVFVSRMTSEGKTYIQFGDGVTGARLPTGQQNVRARYRKGIGTEGILKAGQINLLMSRPLGLKEAMNPVPSTDAKDPEAIKDARQNAPLTVLTLDRVVSLQDYEDFSRAFAGIAKARATWTWFGQTRGVFITVAGWKGGPVSLEGRQQLRAAIAEWGDPFIPVRVENYQGVSFRLGLRLTIAPDYERPKVLARAEEALREHFSFERRAFGQAVTLAEVSAVAQAVPGVVAVQVTRLYRGGDADVEAGLSAPLGARAPQPGERDMVAAAELLTLDPAPLDQLEEMT